MRLSGEEKMTDDKCLKCGTKIPKEARFCPSCGAVKGIETPQPVQSQPVQPQPVQPQPVVQPQPMQSPSQPIHETLGPLFSKNLIIMGVLLGILLAWIGSIIGIFAVGTVTIGAMTVNAGGDALTNAGLVLKSLGFVFIGLFLTGGGIINKDIDKSVRLGMIVGGAITIAMGL